MSRILIVTAFYHPFIHPRAHRWTALAEHWAAQGHEVHVVTARQRGFSQQATEHGVTVHRRGFDSLKEFFYYHAGSRQARGRVGAPVQAPGVIIGLFGWLYKKVWKRVAFPDDAGIWYFPAKRKVLQLIEEQTFDLIITVSLPFTGQLIGLAVKRRFPQRPWLADVGDPFSLPEPRGLFKRKMEKKVLEQADTVAVTTTNTRDLYQAVFGPAAVAKMIIIPPLLHPPPQPTTAQTRKPANPQTRKYSLGYFGALYAPLRTPDAFLDLLERTFRLRPDLQTQLEIHFYGDIFPEFYQKLRRQPAITLHGLRPREEVRIAMEQLDLLLHIGNASAYQLPSKAVDYLASGRPVMHLAYVENDAFVRFFGEDPGLLVLKVENGRVGEEDLEKWIDWLETNKPVDLAEQRQSRLAGSLIEAVSAQYLDMIHKKNL